MERFDVVVIRGGGTGSEAAFHLARDRGRRLRASDPHSRPGAGPGVPASLAIIGAGAIGVEFAQLYARFGTRVTVVEVAPRILPNEDEAAAGALVPALEAEGIELHAGVTIRRASHDDTGWRLEIADAETVRA